MTKQQITLLAMAMALSAPAFAAPRECIRDDATGHARIMHTLQCQVSGGGSGHGLSNRDDRKM